MKLIMLTPEYHQSNRTSFISVLAPGTSNTMVVDKYITKVLKKMGIVLTDEVYDGARITNQNKGQEELNQSQKSF